MSVEGKAGLARAPQVAVVVPVHNGRVTLPGCLEALKEQTLAPRAIYVVDNGSTDGTWEWLQREQGRWERLEVLREARRGPAAARNAGIRAALDRAGVELVAFVDADCRADRGWLETLARVFEEDAVGAATGCVRGVGNQSLVGRYTALVAWDASRADTQIGEADYTAVRLAGCNACVRAAVLRQVGLFNADLKISEDWDLGLRIVRAGWRLRYVSAAVVHHHYLERTLAYLVRRVVKYGPGRPAVLRRHFPHRLFLRAAGLHLSCRSPLTGSVQLTSPDKITTFLVLGGFLRPWVWALLIPYVLYLGGRIRRLSLRQGAVVASPWQLLAMAGLNVLESYAAAASLLVHSICQGVFCV